jgi:hypothetical protein
MTQPPEGAQRSEDGNYWWDGNEWQPMSADAGGSHGGGQGVAKPPEVVLVGTAGFDPAFPVVGQPIEYTWSEENIGGPTPDTYHAKVEFKDPDGNIIDSDLVECSKLETNGQATRSKTLSAPQKATIGYSIELWVDVDHNTNFSEGLNYAYHNVDASDPT